MVRKRITKRQEKYEPRLTKSLEHQVGSATSKSRNSESFPSPTIVSIPKFRVTVAENFSPARMTNGVDDNLPQESCKAATRLHGKYFGIISF